MNRLPNVKVHMREFQEMMKRIYFHRDSARGPERTYIWLVEEVGELGDALLKGDRAKVEEEMADVIAWLASLANVLGIDLERAALKRYNNACPKCGRSPCVCEVRG